MDLNEYQSLAMRTKNNEVYVSSNPEGEYFWQILDGLMGLNGEAGEAIDIYKKCLFQGHEYEKEPLIGELGDCLWYIALIADAIGEPLETIAQYNIDKLKHRYPDGFDEERSVNRDERRRNDPNGQFEL